MSPSQPVTAPCWCGHSEEAALMHALAGREYPTLTMSITILHNTPNGTQHCLTCHENVLALAYHLHLQVHVTFPEFDAAAARAETDRQVQEHQETARRKQEALEQAAETQRQRLMAMTLASIVDKCSADDLEDVLAILESRR